MGIRKLADKAVVKVATVVVARPVVGRIVGVPTKFLRSFVEAVSDELELSDGETPVVLAALQVALEPEGLLLYHYWYRSKAQRLKRLGLYGWGEDARELSAFYGRLFLAACPQGTEDALFH